MLGQKGATIADVSVAWAILEADAAAVIARRRDPADADALRLAVEQAEAMIDPVGQLEAQQQFHQLLIERAGNHTVALLHAAVQRIMDRASWQRASSRTADTHAARHIGARAHRRLLVLAEAGDARGAARLWKHHIQATHDYLQHDHGTTQLVDLLD